MPLQAYSQTFLKRRLILPLGCEVVVHWSSYSFWRSTLSSLCGVKGKATAATNIFLDIRKPHLRWQFWFYSCHVSWLRLTTGDRGLTEHTKPAFPGLFCKLCFGTGMTRGVQRLLRSCGWKFKCESRCQGECVAGCRCLLAFLLENGLWIEQCP